MNSIATIDELEAIYGQPREAATVKEIDRIIPEYRTYIEASPFMALATVGPEGLDCSPRGDRPGFVRVQDERTLLIPGSTNTFRVNGRAYITDDTPLCESFAVENQAPRTVIVVEVDAAYFQCGRAIVRSELWNPSKHIDPATLPTPGEILAALSDNRVGGENYDREWPERARKTLW